MDTASLPVRFVGMVRHAGYALDVCAVVPERLAVLDMLDGLSLFQAANPPVRMHHIPISTFGDDLMALYCDPYSDGRSGHLVVGNADWDTVVGPDESRRHPERTGGA